VGSTVITVIISAMGAGQRVRHFRISRPDFVTTRLSRQEFVGDINGVLFCLDPLYAIGLACACVTRLVAHRLRIDLWGGSAESWLYRRAGPEDSVLTQVSHRDTKQNHFGYLLGRSVPLTNKSDWTGVLCHS